MDSLPPKPVTLKQIAAALGLSVTTVARSLNDGHKIGADTVARVRAMAQQLGYVRNLDGLRLRTGRTMTLLALLGSSDDAEVGDPGTAGLLSGMQSRLMDSDYILHALPLNLSDRTADRLAAILRDNPSDGVIIDHIEPADPRIALLERLGLPFVAFGRNGPTATHAYFEIDNIHAARQGTASLIARGHRRPALIEATPDLNFAAERVTGYRKALAEAGLPFDPALVLHCPTDAAAIRHAVADLARVAAPDSYVCSNEIFLFGTIAGLRDAGLDPAAHGFNLRAATNLAAYLGLPLTTSFYPRASVGHHLADLLLRRLAGEDTTRLRRLVQTELRTY